MSQQKAPKLNHLMTSLADGDLVSARWLRRHGYSTALVARYVRNGWLESPARGVYQRAGGRPDWSNAVRSLQQREALGLYPGGRFALAAQGAEHYLQLGSAPTLSLYGNERPPAWVLALKLPEELAWCGRAPFSSSIPKLSDETDEEHLYAHGLLRTETDSSGTTVVMSTLERAMLELCASRANTALVLEVDALMQGMSNLRPQLMQALLMACTSVQAKRLFLVLAERHRHAWLARLDLDKVDLGSGKRALVPGGRLDPKYQITLPVELEQALG